MKKHLFFLLSCKKDDEAVIDSPEKAESIETKLLQLQGTQLVDGNKNPVFLQGVAFNNFVWGDVYGASLNTLDGCNFLERK